MENDPLATYLNDHLAGSVAAIELLGRLADNADADPARKQEMLTLRDKIQEDQAVLQAVLEAHSSGQSTVKKAGAWLMEKFTRAKLHLAESEAASLGHVEALEVLSLGVAGKRGLWEVLREVLPASEFSHAPWDELIQSADAQRQTVEAWRLEAARKAFQNTGAADAGDSAR